MHDLNLGSANGVSCDPALANSVLDIGNPASGYNVVPNDQFQGGYITRHYGQPQDNIHAVQLEVTQSSYIQEAIPFNYLPKRAVGVQPRLRRVIEAVLGFARERGVA